MSKVIKVHTDLCSYKHTARGLARLSDVWSPLPAVLVENLLWHMYVISFCGSDCPPIIFSLFSPSAICTMTTSHRSRGISLWTFLPYWYTFFSTSMLSRSSFWRLGMQIQLLSFNVRHQLQDWSRTSIIRDMYMCKQGPLLLVIKHCPLRSPLIGTNWHPMAFNGERKCITSYMYIKHLPCHYL